MEAKGKGSKNKLQRQHSGNLMKIEGLKHDASASIDDENGVDEITCEILSRLPVKSLMRFKCVCKSWRALVEKDDHFIDLHLTNSRKRLMFLATVDEHNGKNLFDITKRHILIGDCKIVDEGEERNVIDIHSSWEVNFMYSITGPLHGLIGFVNYSNYLGIRLANACTREITPWMKSEFVGECEKNDIIIESYACALGFDPVAKEYKVICILKVPTTPFYVGPRIICEVLTIGDDKWRRIDLENFSSRALHGRPAYMNGCMYYNALGANSNQMFVFDVGREKFRATTIPDSIVSSIEYSYTFAHLIELDGYIGIVARIKGGTCTLWLYDVANDISSLLSWSKIIIELPYAHCPEKTIQVRSFVGRSQILLKTYKDVGELGGMHYISCDRRSGKNRDLDMTGIVSTVLSRFSNPSSLYHESTFVESLLHVL